MTDDVLFEEGEYRDAIRLAATDAGHAILDKLTDSDRGERVTMDVLDDATPTDTDTPDRVKEMKRAALIVERRGPETDPYYVATNAGQTALEHVTAGIRALQDGEPTSE